MPSVAVIGAGVAGITALKSLLEEGLDAVAFDANQDVGGVWHYRDQVEGHPTVMDCTVMNSSIELSSFSDFPSPNPIPNFAPHYLYKNYLRQYVQHFKIGQHIRLGHRVEKVRPTDDHNETGRWEVTVLNLESGGKTVSVFDAVVVCSGKHSKPRLPSLPGLDRFKGRVVHSSEYKNTNGYQGKNVLVVGIGNSASDIAVELSGVASKVYLSTRSGGWLFGRLGLNGLPGDLSLFTRFFLFLHDVLPYGWVNNYLENKLTLRIDHAVYNLQPSFRALSHYPTITDDLHFKLAVGRVHLRKDVVTFLENSVRFKGEENEVVDIDEVVMATGFVDSFPFLERRLWPIKDQKLDLFQYTFPAEAEHHTLAFVGMAYAFGPQAPVMEMQGRWIARVLSGKCKLPSRKAMIKQVEFHRLRVLERFGPHSLLNGQMDWLPYMDEMAGYIGAKPRLWLLLFLDPRLFYHCVFGPAVSYMYRLKGPHPWSGARDAIMGVFDRVLRNFNSYAGMTKKSV